VRSCRSVGQVICSILGRKPEETLHFLEHAVCVRSGRRYRSARRYGVYQSNQIQNYVRIKSQLCNCSCRQDEARRVTHCLRMGNALPAIPRTITPQRLLEPRSPPHRVHRPTACSRRSRDGLIIVYLRESSSYGCSNYGSEISKYALCDGGGQKVLICSVNAQKTLGRNDQQHFVQQTNRCVSLQFDKKRLTMTGSNIGCMSG
jgi:hypothetical protein